MSDTDLDLGRTIRGFASGERLFDRYTLKGVIGRGGMGIVWRAFDEHLERDVALKFLPELIVLDHAALDDLKRETKRNLELTHHNIVRIYDFVHEEQTACISMEFVDGPTLSAARIGRPEKVFEVEQLEPLVGQACRALDYAHNKAKIVHRDLKPANLMLSSRDQLKITDFGIARSLSDSVSMLSMRSSGGTLLYMSPQQLDGERPSSLDDVYSFGATLFELLTGKPPFFRGGVEDQIRNKIAPSIAARRKELNVSAKAVPALWEKTIADCLAKEPRQRPASTREIAERLGLESGSVAPADDTARPTVSDVFPTEIHSAPAPAMNAPAMVPSFVGAVRPSKRFVAAGVCLVALLSFLAILLSNRGTLANWYADIFQKKPSAAWVREVSAEKIAGAFTKGDSLRFDLGNIAIRAGAARTAEVTIDGTAVTRTALYEAVANNDPAVGLESKFTDMERARERARFLRERAGLDVAAIDENAFQFVKEATRAERSLPFHFRFQARRQESKWIVEKIMAASLEPAAGFAGKPLTAFRNPAVLGTDKANNDRAELARLIDSFVANVAKAEEVAAKRFAAQGLDSQGNPLFPPNRAMEGERFPQTRMAAIRADELYGWTEENLQYAINEVFARHGASFSDRKISALFTRFAWYHPKPELSMQQIESSFSDLEQQNVRTLHGAVLAKKEDAARAQQAVAAQRQQQAAQRAQQENARAQQEAAAKAQRDEAARQAAQQIIGGLIQGIINRATRH